MLPKILIAAGNYNITHSVRHALEDENVLIKGSFTHRDTLYMLQQQRFNVVFIDAAMFDRHTDEFTVTALDRLKNPIPRIAVALDSRSERRSREANTEVLTTLDDEKVREAVNGILGKTMPNRNSNTTNLVSKRRVDEMQTLMQLARTLTETLDVEEVLSRVVNAARELTNADEGMILLPEYNADGEMELILRAMVGIDVDPQTRFRVKVDDTYAGDVFRSGIATMEGKRGPIKVKTQHLVNSLLYVPIQLKNSTIGVLGVNNRSKEDVFDLHQRELLGSLASFAAVALENARMHEERTQRARELELLVRASQMMNATLEIADTFTNIGEQICTILDASRADIYGWEPNEQQLTHRAASHLAMWRPLKGPMESLPAERLMELHEQLVIKIDADRTTEYWVAAVSEDRLQGVMRVCYQKAPASAITREQAKVLNNAVLDVMADLLSTVENNLAKKRAEVRRKLEDINQQYKADWSEVWLASGRNAVMYLMARVGKAIWTEPPFEILDPNSMDFVKDALSNKAATTCADNESGACLSVPIVRRDNLMGVVIVRDYDTQRVFSRREIEMAKALAGQAASALDNARLHADLQKSLEELQATQMKLVENVRYYAMGELAAIVAHQINNPLTTIIVDSELLKMTEPKDSRRLKSIEAIHTAGKRASGVAKRLLAMVRPSDHDAEPEVIDVIDTIHGVLQLVGMHGERRNVTLKVRIPAEGSQAYPPVIAVRGQLDDVWMNLITNAYEAMSGQNNAQLGVESSYDAATHQIVVKVWDNGPGISEEVRQKIFSPFFTTKSYGTGLGLHICRKVIEQVNGTIEVESYVGKGTRFTVTLPVVTEMQTAEKR